MAYNVLEALLALGAGWKAGSIALVGFGLDSVIEAAAAGVVLWRVRLEGRGADPMRSRIERSGHAGSSGSPSSRSRCMSSANRAGRSGRWRLRAKTVYLPKEDPE